MSERVRVSDKDFVGAWLRCHSHAEVAEAVGLAPASVLARAKRLREAGVELPAYERVRKGIDVSALNSLIAGVSQP